MDGFQGLKKHGDQIPSDRKQRLVEAAGRLVNFYKQIGNEKAEKKWQMEYDAAKAAAAPVASAPAATRADNSR